MIFVQICIGSSCYIKGSGKLVELFQQRIAERKLEDQIVLSGSFCLGKCNREGVSIVVGDGVSEEIFVGITPEGFEAFWEAQIQNKL